MAKNGIACIFPVHNEAKILTKQIRLFQEELRRQQIEVREIILVENGSQDSSWNICQRLARQNRPVKAIKLAKASYGQAIREGIEVAKSKTLFIFNVDFFDGEFMKQALPLLKTVEIVVASKTLAASRDERSFFRRNLTYLFNAFLRLALNYPGTDTHGIKALKKTPLLLYALDRCRTKNELFDTEMIIRMHRWGAKLMELPIVVKEVRPTRYSWIRRGYHTLIDLVTAAYSKFLMPGFAKRVVVADDYGLNHKVNLEIIRAAKREVLDFVSIMPNMINKRMVNRLKNLAHPVKFSAHLTLVEGKPISPAAQVPTLVDKQGNFYPTPLFLPRLFFGKINLAEVREELDSQIKKLTDLGIKISHLDSHQHSHLFPPIWNLVLLLSNKWRIKAIRSYDSARVALRTKPMRYVIFIIMFWLLQLKYGRNKLSTKEMNEIVVHPGARWL